LEITDEVIVVFQWNVRLHSDSFSVFFLVTSGVEIAGELEKGFSWITVEFFCTFDILL